MKISISILFFGLCLSVSSQEFCKLSVKDFENKLKPIIENKRFKKNLQIRQSYKIAGKITNNKLKNEILNNAYTQELRPKELYGKLKKSTVIVGNAYYCNSCPNVHIQASSGYIISEDGCFVSNNHVAEIAASTKKIGCFVYTSTGKVYTVEKILARDSIHDIAIFKINSNEKFIPVKFNLNPKLGSKLYAIHHPKKIPYYFSQGVLTNHFFTNNKYSSLFCISAEFAEGSSGGPVFDNKGNLIATIASSKAIYMKDNKYNTELHMVNYFSIPAQYLLSLFN